ncbi:MULTISPECIES: hypothetical protein [Microtetraspora]|uniref:Uncharacterized protein n=1 Tax=Microtetraspora glauca TaxID=1996 RepID=A0ABV3GLM7_MICGL|nr:hypothetical protein [Microtetraspora sp. AC03309]MCC5578112.1 hypothetical protein [Microtetraspora sp. AC03309]
MTNIWTPGSRYPRGGDLDWLPPLAQSPDAEGDPEDGPWKGWYVPGADSSDDVEEPSEE